MEAQWRRRAPVISIVIPTNRPPDVLAPCLQSIAAQRFDPADIEVLVITNGVAAPQPLNPHAWPFRLVADSISEANIAAAKNVALDRAVGEWVILLNDDVRLKPDFVAAHVATHRTLNRPAMVLGSSAWEHYADETVFDRMIQTTPMIFFYAGMTPHAWYNFRHAWNLNLSLPRRFVAERRFDARLGPFFYEDLELAFRLERECELRVWYAPEAAACHHHRYTLAGYLDRECEMGRAATRLWRCNPDCFRAIYDADLDDEYIDYCRQYVALEGKHEQMLRTELAALAAQRPSELSPVATQQDAFVRLLYQAHVPLKRLAFRRGLLSATDAVSSSPELPLAAAR